MSPYHSGNNGANYLTISYPYNELIMHEWHSDRAGFVHENTNYFNGKAVKSFYQSCEDLEVGHYYQFQGLAFPY